MTATTDIVAPRAPDEARDGASGLRGWIASSLSRQLTLGLVVALLLSAGLLAVLFIAVTYAVSGLSYVLMTATVAVSIVFLVDIDGAAADPALATRLTHADVIGSYAGLRPLIDNGAGHTADVSRDHAVIESDSGMFSIVGGKLTEYRYMAEDAVDRAVAARGLIAGPCRTRDLPLIGAPANPGAPVAIPADLPASLVARFGAEAANVVAAATCPRPTEPVADGVDVIRAEFEYAVTHEGALSADDILDRRTRIGLVPADRVRAEAAAAEFC